MRENPLCQLEWGRDVAHAGTKPCAGVSGLCCKRFLSISPAQKECKVLRMKLCTDENRTSDIATNKPYGLNCAL